MRALRRFSMIGLVLCNHEKKRAHGKSTVQRQQRATAWTRKRIYRATRWTRFRIESYPAQFAGLAGCPIGRHDDFRKWSFDGVIQEVGRSSRSSGVASQDDREVSVGASERLHSVGMRHCSTAAARGGEGSFYNLTGEEERGARARSECGKMPPEETFIERPRSNRRAPVRVRHARDQRSHAPAANRGAAFALSPARAGGGREVTSAWPGWLPLHVPPLQTAEEEEREARRLATAQRVGNGRSFRPPPPPPPGGASVRADAGSARALTRRWRRRRVWGRLHRTRPKNSHRLAAVRQSFAIPAPKRAPDVECLILFSPSLSLAIYLSFILFWD